MDTDASDLFADNLSEEPTQGELLSKALLEWTDLLDSVRALAGGERTRLIEEGWDEENAEAMAMAVYGNFLAHLIGAR